MLWKIVGRLFNFRKNFKWALVRTFIVYLFLALLLFGILLVFICFKDIWNKKNFAEILTKFFSKQYLKINLISFLGFTIFYLIFVLIANYSQANVEYSKEKDKNNIFLWNERTKQGDWKCVKKDFIDKTNQKANWILGYKIDPKSKKKIWIVNQKDTHAKIIGGTGSGKSQYLVLPNITYNAQLDFKEKPCMFITDPKKELYETMSNYLSDNGYEIKLIDLIDQDGETWNPLMFCYEILNSKDFNQLRPNDYENMISAVNEIVEDLGWPESKNDIWIRSSKSILTAIYMYMMLKSVNNTLFKKEKIERLKEEEITIIKAAEFLSPNEFQKGQWRKEIEVMAKHNIYWRRLYDIFSNLPSKAENTLEGMLSNAQGVINEYAKNYKLSETISSSSLKLQTLFDNMEQTPFVLFICYPDEEEAINKFNSLFVKQLYKYATKYANKQKSKHLPRKLQFYLEEFANLVRIDNFDKSISIARSRWIFFLIIIQSYAQLKKYDTGKGESTTIIDNTGLTYFISSSSIETMENIIKSIGKKQVITNSYNHNDKGVSFSSSQHDKTIFDINDLKEKPANDILIDIPNEKPFIWSMVPFYQGFRNILDDKRSFNYKVSEELKKVRFRRENKTIQQINFLDKKTDSSKSEQELIEWEIKENVMSSTKGSEFKKLFGMENLNLISDKNIKFIVPNIEAIKFSIIEKSLQNITKKRKGKW